MENNKEIIEDQELEYQPTIEEEDNSGVESITQPFSPSDISLSTPPMNMGDLIEMIEAGWVKFDPDYQREPDLWSPQQKSRLIESILLGLRLPAFYFEETSKRSWSIIDGLQRCCAIRDFCVDKTLQLCGLEFLGEKYDGMKYSDFDFATKRDIKMLPITVNLLAQGVPNMVKYILFKRLNTGGVPLTNQEIRNAVFCGPVIDAVREMAHSEEFKRATQGKIESRRKTDMDFVSRFVAFYSLGWENYEPDLDYFINKSLEKLNKENDSDYMQNMIREFKETMSMASDIFGDRAFRKQEDMNERRRSLNKAYFEVISVTLAKLGKDERRKLYENKDLLNENMCKAMRSSQTYNNSYSGGTGDPSSVKLRFSWMEQIIKYTLNDKNIKINDNKIESM